MQLLWNYPLNKNYRTLVHGGMCESQTACLINWISRNASQNKKAVAIAATLQKIVGCFNLG